ncbi:ABC transporter ATP-binding protein [Chengkuizengella axinellae]|uniref:Dipeptide ABC transporter ATP-binding protein n=1 Tax=Chengkuizengella axinellae TaxID=3064388 RepID=A0ABT9IUG0_9BACL|nr:dipeptide ABC transporter ATP-binding protein [Chengkuizengella sp. 2205SS18-9]MDP5272975.1 dipeptide ABC transporter ATP-binding protein [Chengkuizengella sp. 2205SS18-9]
MPKMLLEVEKMKKYFPINGGILGRKIGEVKAVDDVSFSVYEGETFGLVGESGCGKSTTGRSLLRLHEPTEGKVTFNEKEITSLSPNELRTIRRDVQMIFQDPFASLNPRQTVEKILEEPLIVHNIGTPKERKQMVSDMLDTVGLNSYHAKRYPHQFSGGQRQRIGIARALMTKPKLIIADEPVSALDVSIQSQILNLLDDLQKGFSLTYIFIAHDLGVVRHICDRVGVMYLGKIVELSSSEKLYEKALHPYTEALLSSVPIPDPTYEREHIELIGDMPSPSNPPTGCSFHTRCPQCMEICKTVQPKFEEIEEDHYVACHLFSKNEQL